MWKNTAEPDRPQKTTWRMRIVCWIPNATNTLSEYVILIAFPQQRLHERDSVLHYTCIASPVRTAIHNWNKNEKNTRLEFILVNSHRSTPCNATFVYIRLSLSNPRRRIGTSGVPRNFVRGGVQQIQLRTERTGSGGGSPLVRGSGGSCNLVQEISIHIGKLS